MKPIANNALQAATDYAGIELTDDLTRKEVEEYFTEENFRHMWPGDDPTECVGYTLNDCADAVCEELGL